MLAIRSTTPRLAGLACALLALALPACRCSPTEPSRGRVQGATVTGRTATGEVAPAGGGSHTYTVRAEVLRLPDPEKPNPTLAIRHEAIDGFVDQHGTVVGMDAMVMFFPVAPSAPTGNLAVGDPVSVRFTVVYRRDSVSVTLDEVELLPAGTELRFGRANPRRGEAARP